MPTYITYNTLGDDSIRIFLSDPIVVGLCLRDDFTKLSGIQEVHQPGIYILMDKGNRRYVGQAMGGVHNRLNSHDKNKSWWTDLIFIAHAYGALSPDKLNYLETKLITDLTSLGYAMENGNGGHKSFHISTQQRLQADSFLAEALGGLSRVAGVDLYQKAVNGSVPVLNLDTSEVESAKARKLTVQEKAIDFDSFTPPFTITDNRGQAFTSPDFVGSYRSAYAQWAVSLSRDPSWAQTLLAEYAATWKVQAENGEHRQSHVKHYLSAPNGVFINGHAAGFPLSALRDVLRFSDEFKLDVKVTDADGKDLLVKVKPQRIMGRRLVEPNTVFKIVEDGQVKSEELALSGAYGAYVAWLKTLCEDSGLREALFSFATANASGLLVATQDPNGREHCLYTECCPGLWAYTTLSKLQTTKNIHKLAVLLGSVVRVDEAVES